MAESSLSMGYPDYLARLGVFLGYGASPTGDELTDCQRIIDAGLRRFYGAHTWRFLEPTSTLTLTASQEYADLPDDFSAVISLNFPSNEYENALINVSTQALDEMRSITNYAATKPRYYAVEPQTSDQTTGQRFRAVFWPVPDDAYVMVIRYRALQERLRDATPYALGGQEHAETIMEFILSQAEMERDDERGVHEARAKELLVQSIRRDTSLNAKNYGYMNDFSDQRHERVRQDYYPRVTRGYTYL